MAYINQKYQTPDKTSELQKKQQQFAATLLGNKQGSVDKTDYRRRAGAIDAAGQSATNYEITQRNKREAAKLEAARKAAEQETYRRITTSVGQGQGPDLTPNNSGVSFGGLAGSGASGSFAKFMAAIGMQESSNNYNARNPSGAMGKYQIMPGNLAGNRRGWDFEALGRDVSPQEFMNSPQIQEAIAKAKMQEYYSQYGPRGAAIAWNGGPGATQYSQGALNRSGINNYANSIMRRLGM